MEFHKLAEPFPMIEGHQFDEFVDDVARNGVRIPIVVYEGKILDGRNRYRASQIAGVPCPHEIYAGQDPLSEVISLNLKRRHLSESQRAMVAAKLPAFEQGGDRRSDQTLNLTLEKITAQEAAKLLNVSPSSVRNARQILREGTKDEIAAIESGEASVGTIAREIQRKIPSRDRKKRRGSLLAEKGQNPDRFERQRVNGEVWKRLKNALTDLSSLPLSTDVAAIVSPHTKRAALVDAKLNPALKWIEEFSHAWTNQQRT